MDIKRPSADIHLNPAAGFEELMELLSLVSACVGGLPFPFYLPSLPPISPSRSLPVCSTVPDIVAYSVLVCNITHTCGTHWHMPFISGAEDVNLCRQQEARETVNCCNTEDTHTHTHTHAHTHSHARCGF